MMLRDIPYIKHALLNERMFTMRLTYVKYAF